VTRPGADTNRASPTMPLEDRATARTPSVPASLADAVRIRATRSPDAVAVVDAHDSITWRELCSAAEIVAERLGDLPNRTPLLLLLPQSAASVVLLVAAAIAGSDVVVIAEYHGEEGARSFLDELGGAALLTPDADDGFRVMASRSVTPPATSAGPATSAEPALSLLTSGSTGRPKVVRHTWATLSAGAAPRSHLEGVRWFAAYPIPQFAGLQVFAQSVNCGSTLVVAENFTPEATLRALTAHAASYMSCTPSFARQLLLAFSADDWSGTSLRHISMGGEIVDQPLLDGLRTALPDTKVTHLYGASEVGTLLWVRDGRAGFPSSYLDGDAARIEDGELFVRRSARARVDADADWIATGDLVDVDGDRAYFAGRRDDVINVAGFKVRPADVAAVAREIDGVLDVSITGHASSVAGYLVKAVVYAEPGADTGALRIAIIRRCRERLAPQMTPRLFEFVEGLRLSGTQKLSRGSERA